MTELRHHWAYVSSTFSILRTCEFIQNSTVYFGLGISKQYRFIWQWTTQSGLCSWYRLCVVNITTQSRWCSWHWLRILSVRSNINYVLDTNCVCVCIGRSLSSLDRQRHTHCRLRVVEVASSLEEGGRQTRGKRTYFAGITVAPVPSCSLLNRSNRVSMCIISGAFGSMLQ